MEEQKESGIKKGPPEPPKEKTGRRKLGRRDLAMFLVGWLVGSTWIYVWMKYYAG